MSKKVFSLLLILPLLTFCVARNGGPAGQDGITTQEIHDGDTVLVTNENVEKFLAEAAYPDDDFSFTNIYDYYGGYNGKPEAPAEPDSDIPPRFCIRWTGDPGAGKLMFCLEEPERSFRSDLKAGTDCAAFTNLLPGTRYTYKVSSGKDGRVLAEGCFFTKGHLHQVFFHDNCRNARDLGGWKTADGRTVSFRKVYRGGRMEKWTLTPQGRKDVLAEGIKAQLDLRGSSDVLSKPAVKGLDFCSPVIEQGGPEMLSNDAAKTRQCFEFILNCLREDKPVYYHCSLGRDRTGTLTILLLGALGVPEGDISKEYELTYFAPRGWSIAYSESNDIFVNDRTKWACAPTVEYLRSFAGDGSSFAECVENYLLSTGISQADITDFRRLMLTD